MSIPDFKPGTTVRFTATITIDDVAADIRNDTVTIRLKTNLTDTDAQAVLDVDADVATQGADGIAEFELTPADTAIAPGCYFYDIVWVRVSGAEYVLYTDRVQVEKRVSDA